MLQQWQLSNTIGRRLEIRTAIASRGVLCVQGFVEPCAAANSKCRVHCYIHNSIDAPTDSNFGGGIRGKYRPSALACVVTSFVKPHSTSSGRKPISTSTAVRVAGPHEPGSLIEKQKARASQLWKERCSEGSLDPSRFTKSIRVEELVKSVACDLKNGVVPPIFHSVVSKGKPLFSSTSHKLSPDPVRPGTVTKNAREPILTSLSNPYDVLFSDKPSLANPRVLDGSIPLPGAWDFDEIATDGVAKLVNTKAIMLGADVESTEGLKSVLFQDPSAKTFSLLTRSQSRGVVANVFDSSESGSSLGITGSPGIGKSWTLLYALQQALLYENAIVVFILQGRSGFSLRQKGSLCLCLESRSRELC
jgi:hypothetical protein